MCCSKRSAEVRLRGMTLIELIIAQMIVAFLAAVMFSLIASITKSVHEDQGSAEAQVRLREASSVMLRTLQGIGGAEGKAGFLVMSTDGGPNAADSLTIFRADYGVCAGAQSIQQIVGNEVELVQFDIDGDTFPDCPLDMIVGCNDANITSRVHVIEGQTRSAQLVATSIDATTCRVTFGNGAVQSLQIAAYDEHFGSSAATVPAVLGELGAPVALRFGSTIRFSVDPFTDGLLRSIDGQTPTTVLEGVYDLQVVTAHDLAPSDGAIDPHEWSYDGALAGATPDNFFGVRVGLLTYGKAKNIPLAAPPVFGNRFHNAAPAERRYRASWLFAAARNR